MSPVFWIAFISLAAGGLLDNSRGPLFPHLLRGISLNDTQGALFFSTASAAALFATLTAPYPHRKIGSWLSLQLSLLIMAISFFTLTQVQGLAGVIICAALFGLGYGSLTVHQNVLIQERTPPHSMLRVQSLFHAMYGMASLLAPIAVSLIFQQGYDWRRCFFILAFAPVLLLSISIFFKDDTETLKKKTTNETPPFLFDKKTFLFMLMVSLYVANEILISTRLVLYVDRLPDFSFEQGNHYLFLFFLTLTTGRFMGGLLPSSNHPKRLLYILGFSTIALELIGIFIHPLALAFTGLSMSVFFPASVSYLYTQTDRAVHAISNLFMGNSIALVLMHQTTGWVTDKLGMTAAIGLAPVLMFCSLIALNRIK